MSMPYRDANGEMIRINWNTDFLVRLDKVEYVYKNFTEADKENKKLTKGMDKLFNLNKENFEQIINNSLYPAYYLINYNKEEIYTDPVDLVKFGDISIDPDSLMWGVDLQLLNNIIFMVGNSSQMTTFNGSRNLWYKVMEAYGLLCDNNEEKLRFVLSDRYNYSDDKIDKYCKDFTDYVFSFYEREIKETMSSEKCYECFKFFKSLRESSIRKKVYSDLNETFNDFLLDVLQERVNKMSESGYCYDLFEDRFFAKEILELSDLNSRKKDKVLDLIFNTYKDCVDIRIKHNDYVAAKESYDIIASNSKFFDYKQRGELEPFKQLIDKNCKKDPRIKKQKRKDTAYFMEDKIVMPIILLSILVGIICIVGCLITKFKNPIWNTILIVDIVIFVILLIIEKILINIQYSKKK